MPSTASPDAGAGFPCASLAEALRHLRRPPAATAIHFEIQTAVDDAGQLVAYEGRLESFAECARQDLEAPGPLTGTGVRYIPVVHAGNGRQSPEEAKAIAEQVQDLLGGRYVNAKGHERPLEPADIMVVSPYNAQVRDRLRRPLGRS
jgi:hypothetical protein